MILFRAAQDSLEFLPQIMPIISIAFYMVLIRIAMKRQNIVHHLSTTLKGTATIGSQVAVRGMRSPQVHLPQLSRSDSTPQYWFGNQEDARV